MLKEGKILGEKERETERWRQGGEGRKERREREEKEKGGMGRQVGLLVLWNTIWKTWIVFSEVLCPINIYVGTLTCV